MPTGRAGGNCSTEARLAGTEVDPEWRVSLADVEVICHDGHGDSTTYGVIMDARDGSGLSPFTFKGFHICDDSAP